MGRCIGEQLGRKSSGSGTVEVADGDPGQREGTAVGGLEFRGSVEQRPRDLASDRAGAEEGDPERGMAHRRTARSAGDGSSMSRHGTRHDPLGIAPGPHPSRLADAPRRPGA